MRDLFGLVLVVAVLLVALLTPAFAQASIYETEATMRMAFAFQTNKVDVPVEPKTPVEPKAPDCPCGSSCNCPAGACAAGECLPSATSTTTVAVGCCGSSGGSGIFGGGRVIIMPAFRGYTYSQPRTQMIALPRYHSSPSYPPPSARYFSAPGVSLNGRSGAVGACTSCR